MKLITPITRNDYISRYREIRDISNFTLKVVDEYNKKGHIYLLLTNTNKRFRKRLSITIFYDSKPGNSKFKEGESLMGSLYEVDDQYYIFYNFMQNYSIEFCSEHYLIDGPDGLKEFLTFINTEYGIG